MARLPKPGSDQGKWGEILNDYLSQSHKADGTLKNGSVGSTQLQTNSIGTFQLQDSSITTPKLTDNSVTTTKLADNSVTNAKIAGVGQPNGIATLDTSGKLNESQVPDRLSETAITNEITEQVTPLIEQVGTDAQAALDEMIVSGHVVGDDLVLTRGDGTVVDAGDVRGPAGADGVSATLELSAQTGEPGTEVVVDNLGTPQAANYRLTIPRGEAGSPTAYELRGTGMPNGVVTAPPGTYYTDTAGTNGAWRWLKTSGTGNTGWTVVVGDTGWRSLLATDLSNGWQRANAAQIIVRRVGARVDFISGSSGILGTSATSPVFVTLPVGLRVRLQPRFVAIGSGFVSGSDSPRKVVSDAMAYTLGLSAVEAVPVTFALSWWTDDAWPTTLPYSAA